MGINGASGTSPGDPFSTTTAVAVIDADGLITYWSLGAQDLLGYSAAEVVRHPARALLRGRDPTAAMSRLCRSGHAGDAVLTVHDRVGHAVRLAVRVCPLLTAGDRRDWLLLAAAAPAATRPTSPAPADAAATGPTTPGAVPTGSGASAPAATGPVTPGAGPAGTAPTGTAPTGPAPTGADATRATPADSEATCASPASPASTVPAGSGAPGPAAPGAIPAGTAPASSSPSSAAPTGAASPTTPSSTIPAGARMGRSSAVVTRHARRGMVSGQRQVTVAHAAPRRGRPGRAGRERSRPRSFFPLHDAAGGTLGICYAARNVTAPDPTRERLVLLNAAADHIGTTLDLGRTVQELAEVAVPQLADFVAIDLLDVATAGEGPPTRSPDGPITLRRAAHLSIRPDLPEVIAEVGEPIRYPSGSLQNRCLASGEPSREALGPGTPWLPDDPVRWTGINRFGVHTHLVLPLRARGVTMGVVTLLRWENPDPFTEDDQLLIEDLVARAAVCVDNARRYAREHEAALTLQTSLLPPNLPRHNAVEVAHRYLPADAESGVGGDWYDVIPLSGARVALVVGDVIGHGLHAAASMGRLRAAVQTLADLDQSPDELLAHVNDLVMRLSDEAEAAAEGPAAAGATCVYAIYDPIARTMVVARAGHPSPAVAHLTEPVEFPDIPAGPPLGLGGLPFESAEIPLEEGSVVALYTDGLIQAAEQDVDVGIERLCFALAHPDRPLEEICDVMVRALLADRPRDDVAFLVARTRVLSPDRVTSWDVPPDPSAVRVVRDDVSDRLSQWGLDELAFTTELIVSELVTNAIRHARGPIALRLIHESTLICEVSDGGHTSPHLRRARSTDEGGRGLFLVAQLAQRWGTRYTGSGKTIWAEQPLPSDIWAKPSISSGLDRSI
ncbi:SpoIIE family protein phosphatase [Streptomyces sp. NPDC088337]|uniref:ATP-binding SpoIIE family protein phosphatase n=1 Tax=unclassified Streptomyces TaxID=2593676 RepID=UPI00380D41BF